MTHETKEGDISYTFRYPKELHERLETYINKENEGHWYNLKGRASIIRQALREFLDREEEK